MNKKKKKKVGRPSDFRPAFCKKAQDLAKQGATDREIAEVFDVSESSLYRWKHEHPEFREAMQLGKEAADDRVEQSLYRRAVGYSFDSVKIMQDKGSVIVEPFVEHVPPDTTAATFWLKNRRPAKWRDKHEVEVGEGLLEFLKTRPTPGS